MLDRLASAGRELASEGIYARDALGMKRIYLRKSSAKNLSKIQPFNYGRKIELLGYQRTKRPRGGLLHQKKPPVVQQANLITESQDLESISQVDLSHEFKQESISELYLNLNCHGHPATAVERNGGKDVEYG